MAEDLSVAGALKALENVSLDAPAAEGANIEQDQPPPKKKKTAPAPVVEDDADGDDGVIDETLGRDGDGDDDDDDGDGAAADASDADGDDGDDAHADGDASDDADGDEADDGDDGEPDAQAIDPPQSLNEEQRKVFKELPRKAQQILADHDKALVADHTRKTKEIADTRKVLASRINVLREVVTEKEKRMQKWEKVDWVAQAQRLDPKVLLANKEQYAKEKAEYERSKTQLAEQEKADLDAHDAEQLASLPKVAPHLVGEKGKPAREAVIKACVDAGIPVDQLRWITATQMAFVHDALKWREYQAARKKPPTITAKPGEKAKGKVVSPAPRNQTPKNMQLANVKKRFMSKPSKENAMSALDAMDVD